MGARIYQYILRIFFIVSFTATTLYGQEISLIHHRTEDEVLLRWAPATVAVWQEAIRTGVTIERFTIARDSTRVYPAIRKTLAKALKPLQVDDWKEAYLSNKYAAIAAQALYGESFLIGIDQNDLQPLQAIQLARDQEARLSYLLLLSEQSFMVAKMAGLGIADSTTLANESYLYKLFISGGYEASDTTFVYVEAGASPPLPTVKDLDATFSENRVELNWSIDHLRKIYSSFQIEISTNGEVFYKVDSLQSITAEVSNNRPGYFVTTVELPYTNQQYFVRVRGMSSFGILGPPGKAISGYSRINQKYELSLTEQFAADSLVKLNFEISPSPGLKQDVDTIILRRSADSKLYRDISKFSLGKSELHDLRPIPTAYYQAVMIDSKGREFKSSPILVQIADSIPPMPPQNLQAYCDTTGVVHLSWKSNLEADLGGYRLHRSRIEDAEYRQITSSAITDTVFQDTVGLSLPASLIFYKVQAEDSRFNRSSLSIPTSVITYDTIPPVAARITGYAVLDSAVRLDWVPSTSKDVIHTMLLRETEMRSDTIVLDWNRTGGSLSFYDTTEYLGKVRYSLVSVDQYSNVSVRSNIIQAKASVKSKTEFKVDVEVDRTEGLVRLSWPETTLFESISVYRSIAEEKLRLVDSLDGARQSFVDTQLVINSAISYLLVFRSSKTSRVFSKQIDVTF